MMADSDTAALTKEQYLMHAMTKIAHSRVGPNSRQITRDELITLAREACDAVGWPYSMAGRCKIF